MKNIKNILLALVFGGTLSITSCSDFMDLRPTGEYLEEEIFEDAGLTQAFIYTLYDNVIDGAREHSTTGLTDDAYFTHNYGQIPVNEATVSESDLQWYDDDNCPFKWEHRYQAIRYANIILKNIDNVPPLDGYSIPRMKGETYFLRAYQYADLVRGFGGVPIVERVYELDETEEMKVSRNNIGECLDFILKDLAMAEELLPETVPDSELGRATKWAATALKARMLLQVASPLYADRTVNTLDVNQYGGDRNELYRKAREAALQVINSGYYTLIDCNGGSAFEIANRYKTIITTNNSEQIFTKQFTKENSVKNNLVLQHGPNGYHNWSGVTPTHDFVMAFEFEDGTLTDGFTNIGDYTTVNPFNGREPRFYASVGTDGNEWGRPRPSDARALDPTPLGRLQCGTYEVTDGEPVEIELPNGNKVSFTGLYGIDTRKGPIEDWNGSWTGYYESKLIDTSIDGQYYPQEVPWSYIRLAEMYLIAAEASIELGELEEGAKYLDAIRGRINLPDSKMTLALRGQSFNQEDMRDLLQRERRVELAFEDSRYYDVRRWMIAPVTASKPISGVLIYGRLKAGQTQNKPYIHNEEKYDYHYYVSDLSGRERRKWENKMYFAPIKRDEIRRSDGKIKQNPGME